MLDADAHLYKLLVAQIYFQAFHEYQDTIQISVID